MSEDIIKLLEDSLLQHPTVVMRHTEYFDPEFVKSCIEQLRRSLVLHVALGEGLNPLEQLGVYFLCGSAYIDPHNP